MFEPKDEHSECQAIRAIMGKLGLRSPYARAEGTSDGQGADQRPVTIGMPLAIVVQLSSRVLPAQEVRPSSAWSRNPMTRSS